MSIDVIIREVGPREGLQSFGTIVPTEKKLKLIELLFGSGVREIEVASFVRPDRVPQMADAPDLVSRLAPAPKGTRYRALYLNQKGFEIAANCQSLTTDGWLYTSASEKFLRDNSNTNHDLFIDQIPSWLELFKRYNRDLKGLMISTAFGSNDEGVISTERVVGVIDRCFEEIGKHGEVPEEISLADTMGWGVPDSVYRLVERCHKEFGEIKVSLHLHDTRGAAIANACAGLEAGVRIFESSVGGVGGCPFAEGASGNVATEDLAFILEQMGYSTGLDLDRYMAAVEYLVELGLAPEGKLHRAWRVQGR